MRVRTETRLPCHGFGAGLHGELASVMETGLASLVVMLARVVGARARHQGGFSGDLRRSWPDADRPGPSQVVAQSAPVEGPASVEEERSSMGSFRTVEVPPRGGEWCGLVDGKEEKRRDNRWRGAQWNGVVGGRRAIPHLDRRLGAMCGQY